ncbi:MAG: pyridoxal-phosphate dependent enzyme [Gemmatimonadaceae bacterium]
MIDPVFLRTPSFLSSPLTDACGARITIKDETKNPIRSFKGRGADFFVAELADPPAKLVCASAGNFGQGLAYAATRRGIACEVFAARTANPLKVQRMRDLGAVVKLAGDDFDAAKDAGRGYAAAAGIPFVEDGRDVAISEGAGTLGVEILHVDEVPDTVVVPLGNGALLGGIATYVGHAAPATRVLGVCAIGASAMEQSWRKHMKITTPDARTIADGIAVRVPIQEALDDLNGVIDDVLLVSDDEILRAMHFMYRHHEQMLEPAGAVGVAALLARPRDFQGRAVTTILCGANVTPEQMRRWFA